MVFNRIQSFFIFRGMAENGIPRVFRRNRWNSDRINVNKNLCSLFRGIIFFSENSNPYSSLYIDKGTWEIGSGRIIFGDTEPRLNLVKTHPEAAGNRSRL
jgi:hypothetical protein